MMTGNECWQVRSGDVMLHPPQVPFSEYANDAGIHQCVMFDIKVAPHIDLFRLHAVTPVVTLIDPTLFSNTFEMLQSVWRKSVPTLSPYHLLQTSALTTQLFSYVLESWQHGGSLERPASLLTVQDRFVHVVTYMNNHLDQKLSRDELAALVHLHPTYFSRLFHQIYGVSPMEMLRDLRWRRATALLETTELSLTDIAQACGLHDAAYFSRIFRQRSGQTPGRYRQSVKSTRISPASAL